MKEKIELSEADIGGVNAKVSVQHYQRLNGDKSTPCFPPTKITGPQASLLYLPQWREIWKTEGKDYSEKPDQQLLVAIVRPVKSS